MQAEHFDQILKALKQRMPFRPFTVTLRNGEEVNVDLKEAMIIRDGVAAFIQPGGIPVLFDHESVVEVSS